MLTVIRRIAKRLFGKPIPTTIEEMIADQWDEITKHFNQNPMAALEINQDGRLVFSDLANMTCEHYKIKREDLFSLSRKGEVVKARHTLAYLLKSKKRYSFHRIGQLLGRHHTTVIDSINVAKFSLKTGTFIADDIKAIEGRIRL